MGGMNMSVDDTRLSNEEYKFAKNVRNRFGTLEGIKNVNDISGDIGAFTSNPPIQNIYSIGEFVFLFFDGGCKYRKPLNPDSTWAVLYAGGTMDRSAEIFLQAVPASTSNFMRKDTSVIGASIELEMDTPVQTTVAAIIVQDGVSQPRIIELAGGYASDRSAKTYADWLVGGVITGVLTLTPAVTAWEADQTLGAFAPTSTDGVGINATFSATTDGSGNPTFTLVSGGTDFAITDTLTFTDPGSTSNTAVLTVNARNAPSREYVPIGKQMTFFNNKLFIISPDGTLIYHSVSGRPLDFVVAITGETGDKVNADETIGGAPGSSYTVGYNVVTALTVMNNEALFVSTQGGSYGVTLNYDTTVFAEPMFKKQLLFTANSINQRSFVDLLGDFAFIDPEGLRSFNAVVQSKNEGRNSIFSLKVARLFKGIVQDTKKCAAIVYDDYALFACNTIFGHGILVYDTLTQQFVSFDQLTDDSNSNIGPVIEFAKVETNNKRELFAITHGTTTSGATINNGSGYSIASGLTIVIDALPIYLPSGSVLQFTGGGVLTLTSLANAGATSLSGNLTIADLTDNEKGICTVGYRCVKLFEGSNYATTYVETRAFCTNDTRVEQKPQELRLLFNKVQSASSVTATQRVNDEVTPDTSAGTQSKTLAVQAAPITFSTDFPVVWSGPKMIQNLLYNFQSGQQGWKISYTLQWTNGINLSNIQLQTQDITPMNPMLSQAYVS